MGKVLGRIISYVAGRIVGQEQRGFVYEWFILDTDLSAWEAMKWARESGQEILFLKINFEKAYDRIDWTFITNILTCLGFGQGCVGMINTFFTCAFSFVLGNNVLSPHIHLHRFSKQGCPLAPWALSLCFDNFWRHLVYKVGSKVFLYPRGRI